MNNKLKALALVTAGLVVGAVVGRVKKNIPSVTVKLELENREEYQKILKDIQNFKPIFKRVKN